MLSYEKLLSSPQWKNKRSRILNRDNHQCQRCGTSAKNHFISKRLLNAQTLINENNNIKIEIDCGNNFNNVNIIKFYFKESPKITCKTNLEKLSEIKDKKLCFILNFVDKDIINYPFNGSSIDKHELNYFHSKEFNEIFYPSLFLPSIEEEIERKNLTIDKEGVYFVPYSTSFEYCKSSRLHVHHKCYRKGKEIWNQIDSEYITLCNVCHRIVHENQLIPFYDKNGDILQYMKPCIKCNGLRYFKEYKHVQGGICFRCRGSGFEANYDLNSSRISINDLF